MPLVEHFRDLRKRVVRAALAIIIASGIGWFFYGKIIKILASPICDLDRARKVGANHCGTLYVNGVLGPLNLQIKVSILVGIIISAPFWIYQLWAFIAPGLHKKEKRTSIFFIAIATPFFALGAGLGYYILPLAVRVLLGFTPHSLTNLVRFDDYLDFVLRVILLFGGAFELPVFLVALNLAGVITGKGILKPWRIAVFGITLFTAAFTPTGDPLTMSLLALPLIIFYFAAGGIALLVDRRRGKRVIAIPDDQASTVESAAPLEMPEDIG
jgi:sec-independent protein translocase protein TatC